MCELRAAQNIAVHPLQHILVAMCTNEDMSTSQGTIEATPSVTGKTTLPVTPARIKLENYKTIIQTINLIDHTYTINQGVVLASFALLTPTPA